MAWYKMKRFSRIMRIKKKRKSSNKGDKILELNDTDSEPGNDPVATRSQAKMSLLGGSSFCCASGQKEDYLPEAKILPSKKRSPNAAAKQAHESSAPSTPVVPPSKALLKNRRGKIIESNSEDTLSLSSETGLKFSHEDIKIRPPGDSRLRPPDQRGRNAPSSPHRKISRDPLPYQKEILEAKKAAEAAKKVRKDSSPRVPPKDFSVDKKCRRPSVESISQKVDDPSIKSNRKVSLPNFGNAEFRNGSSDKVLAIGDLIKMSPSNVCKASGVPGSIQVPEDNSAVKNATKMDKSTDCEISEVDGPLDDVDCAMTDTDAMQKSHNSDDFDCPCCDRTVTLVDGPMSDSEINVFTSCDVVPWPSENNEDSMEVVSNKEKALQQEVEALKDDLQAERLKVKTQQDRVLHLEEELIMMEQLKNELEKEKELRKIAEDKLLEVLDYEKRMEVQRRQNEKRMESKGTQKDDPDINASESSPLMMGYESRLRRYQTYITKLENDNLTLVNELKKFKDMSPGSQEDQAKLLIEKLGEIQRNSHQQQLQYESCLDEVANRLVHTLLVQKRLEEECKVLHLRVEQLEHENGTLMELIDEDKNDNVIKPQIEEEEVKQETLSSKVQNKLPSPHSVTSSPVKKNSTTRKPSISSEEKAIEPSKSTNANPAKNSEPKSPVTSPMSPGSKLGSTSKIPAFNSTKPAVMRKKSKIENQPAKTKSEIHPKEPTSPSAVPNFKSSSSKNKTPVNSENSKGTSVKRKRLSRNGSPAEKGVKDSKQRMKSNHMRWEQRRTVPEDLTSLCKSSKEDLSPLQGLSRQQQIWSFNCEVDRENTVPESSRKVADSINSFHKMLDGVDDEHSQEAGKQNLLSSNASAAIDGTNRTRDEGYSTMSSDLQPDSVADTITSEPEHSATFIATEKELRCVSDDSVTECLDGSMCSSSDSGFGPLHQVANSKSADFPEEEQGKSKEPSKTAQDIPRNISTVRHKEQIASVKPTIRNIPPPTQLTDGENELCNKPSSLCDNFINSNTDYLNELKKSTDELKLSPIKARNILEKLDASLQSSTPQKSKLDYISMLDYWNYPKDILDITSRGKTWHLGPKTSNFEDQIVFCSKHSYIDDNIFDEKVETAEKATLTEPEEGRWREKALAPFIDESIWSLYSSEGDIRVKHFPLEPLLSEPSLDQLITDCSPCIIITEDINDSEESDLPDASKPQVSKTSSSSPAAEVANGEDNFKNGLERVASDTVLYLKDAIHELEDSMHRGLKSSKNVSSLHNSGSESEASPSGFKPELLLNLETTVIGQSRLVWPSPTRSSSASSLQSSTSFQVISDEMDDVDLLRTSRKGSQDPDLSSASDAEYENLEHKDFVERWLQNEIPHSANVSKIMISHLEPVKEIAESSPPPIKRRTSLPPSPSSAQPRPRFMSYPQTSTFSFLKFQHNATKLDTALSVSQGEQNSDGVIHGSSEDVEFQGVDSEAKEFNGDFYKLCNIGSLRSLDHFSPAKSHDAQIRHITDSPHFNRKTFSPANLSKKCEKPNKPTGLVKPTRPVTLVVNSIPNVPEHCKSNSVCPPDTANVTIPETSEQNAKTKQVPPKSVCTVFQEKSSPSPRSLPVTTDKKSGLNQTSKLKGPTKFIVKSSSSPKRYHSKRDAINARQNRLKEGCGTAWVHLQANPELSDPMARISILDSLKAPTSSSGSSTEDEEEEEVLVIQTNSHLHRICRERRHKVKASANNPLYEGKRRSSIVGRSELFYRFGDKEREAIACFDFLEELPTSSMETLHAHNSSPSQELLPARRMATPPSDLCPAGREALPSKGRISFLSPTASNNSAAFGNQSSITRSFSSYRKMKLPNLWNQPLSHNMSSSTLNSQDCELLDHISLSDSCAESYSSTPESYEETS